MQKLNGDLKIITKNYSGKSAIHVYTIDIDTKTLIDDEMLISTPEENHNGYSHIDVVYESDPTQSHKYVVLKKTVAREIAANEVEQNDGSPELGDRPSAQHQDADGVKMEEVNTLIAYNLETNETQNISLPQELDEKVTTSYEEGSLIQVFDGVNLYFITSHEDGVLMTPYHLESEEIGNVVKVQTANNEEGFRTPFATIKRWKMYTLSPFLEDASAAKLFITDIKSGEVLYSGQVVDENPNTDQRKYELYIYDMSVR